MIQIRSSPAEVNPSQNGRSPLPASPTTANGSSSTPTPATPSLKSVILVWLSSSPLSTSRPTSFASPHQNSQTSSSLSTASQVPSQQTSESAATTSEFCRPAPPPTHGSPPSSTSTASSRASQQARIVTAISNPSLTQSLSYSPTNLPSSSSPAPRPTRSIPGSPRTIVRPSRPLLSTPRAFEGTLSSPLSTISPSRRFTRTRWRGSRLGPSRSMSLRGVGGA